MNNRRLILVVDDNEINLKLACDLLELEGYAVLRSTHAEGALELLSQQVPDLALLDIALPGMDGIQLARLLREREGTRPIKIIALTAFAMKGDKERVLGAGFDGYITKPIDTRQFTHQIENFFKT